MAVETFDVLATGRFLTLRAARNTAARQRVFDFTRRCFLLHYNAEIEDDSADSVGAFDANGTLVAAFGLRDSVSGFFCEHYLEAPLGEEIGRHFGLGVSRDQIVEVTHLCASRPGFLRELVPLLPGVLVERGYRYLTCTATHCLARYFGRRGIPSFTLAIASREALPDDEQERWGAYYASEPRVMVGDLHAAADALGLATLQNTGS